MLSWFFFSCVFLCVCAQRRSAGFWQIKSKFFWEMNLSFVMNLCTWKRIGAGKKHVIRFFFLMCIFMRLCAAQKRTVLTYKIKVFLRDEFKLREVNLCTWKRIGARKKHVIRFFFLMCIFMRLCAAQKRTILRNKIKVFLRNEWDESLHLKTHRRKEKITYNPNFDFGAVYTNTIKTDIL